VAVATFFTGSMFSLNNMNQVHWATHWYGLEALLNIRNLALGFAVLFLVRINGLLYLINTINDEALLKRSVKGLVVNSIPFLISFLFFVVSLLLSKGFSSDAGTGMMTIEKFKYLHNFIQMPVVMILFLAGVVSVLVGIGIAVFRKSLSGIWYSGAGTILAVFALFLVAGFNGTSFYPSLFELQSSLTIKNASSSHFTLKTMMYVSFIIPFVIAYIWYAWKAINNDRITEEEMNSEEHKY
jgi:cytochrome d ubiquinol oxidase subunit II